MRKKFKKIAKVDEGDIIAIFKNGDFSHFARIERIQKDNDDLDHYKIDMINLEVPITHSAWVLKPEFFNMHPFTIFDDNIQISRVEKMKFSKYKLPDNVVILNEWRKKDEQ
jgi:hypothetical protein